MRNVQIMPAREYRIILRSLKQLQCHDYKSLFPIGFIGLKKEDVGAYVKISDANREHLPLAPISPVI